MEFSRQEYRSGLLFPSPGDFPDPGIEPRSPALRADALPSELPGKPKEPCKVLQKEHKKWKKAETMISSLEFNCRENLT